ncbi:Fic family protein [Vitreoscilla stercoraria]|uniref:Fic family protein n=1 Tax=Vitreoscilla stercoraria TaxID=61 RepID=A0ABY4EG36_VITST|nr:Fic family protein [Vitreoscilla stercoraria]UOO93663.1 Fic family protein [Vitreoscilla stercoraria]
MIQWIWQYPNWPNFTWHQVDIAPELVKAHRLVGYINGRYQESPDLGQHVLDALLINLLSSSAIENERLNAQSVRSSLARRLGISEDQPYPHNERSEGLADIMMDVLTEPKRELSLERLLQWHSWLFPTLGIFNADLKVGSLRGDEIMQVVSGRLDTPTVHYEAPPRLGLEQRLNEFISWFNQSHTDTSLDPIIRAGMVHLWFVTLHPFEDGNGRLTRTLTDLALTQMDAQSIRLYAMSATILEHRADYYRILEQTQKSGLDITPWLIWFVERFIEALEQVQNKIALTQHRALFWQKHAMHSLRPEQIKVLNRLLEGGQDDFPEGISASQYQKVSKVSKATATRHLAELLDNGCLTKADGSGRNTRYFIKSE